MDILYFISCLILYSIVCMFLLVVLFFELVFPFLVPWLIKRHLKGERERMRDECHNEIGMIIKSFEECEQCPDFPCRELCRALQAIIDGEN